MNDKIRKSTDKNVPVDYKRKMFPASSKIFSWCNDGGEFS